MRAAILVGLVTITGGTLLAQRGGAVVQRHDLVGGHFFAKVVRIADGDTVEAIPAGESRPVRIRLHGVDAPEQGEVFSREAQALLRTLLLNQHVRVEARELDRYDRVVARVGAGRDASTELIRAGLACHSYARDTSLAREEEQARTAGRGFWAAGVTKPVCVTATAFSARSAPRAPASGVGPSVARKEGTTTTPKRVPAGYRGNVSSGLYHASTCPNANCRNCTRLFTTEAEAKAAGFKPAGDCFK